MKRNNRYRAFTALVLAFCLLGMPLTAFAKKKGEKNFKQGLEYEAAQQWEKAAQEFTLAVAALPSDAEYRLHYQRSIFNASQQLMQRGRALMEEKDYIGAYNSYRQAYAYDPVNQLAQAEMARALRMYNDRQAEEEAGGKGGNKANGNGGVQVRPTAYTPDTTNRNAKPPARPPARAEELRNFDYNNQDLKFIIRKLADDLGLNVIFDPETFRQNKNIELHLKGVTTGQVLDLIFLQEGLFFQKLSRRTIMVANQTRRAQFQQLVLRTFYLSNVEPEAARALIQQAIPPNQGRPSTIALVDKGSNSLTVRDTAENIALIENLIKSIDKDRAEVVMDVQIYEVSKTDLLQIGNQVGGTDTLSLGGSTGVARATASSSVATGGITQLADVVGGVPTALAAALIIPRTTLTAFQSKGRTRLLASTQIHAFNGEESQARIGQRVPVQTAQTFPFGGFNNNTGNNNNNNGSAFGGGGFPVIQYEPVGLTLKFTPTVFPNQDVQVKMNIESKDVGGSTLTPTFTERTVSGTARIQNNRTMLLASVAQNRESDGRAGIPFLSGLPIFGRLFSAPRKDNSQVDIVIAVTPRVLRAPAITPEDEMLRDSGTLQMPTNGKIAEVVEQAEAEELQLAMANRPVDAPALVNAGAVETVEYVPAARPSSSAAKVEPEFAVEVSSNNALPAPSVMTPVSVPASGASQINVQQAIEQMVNGNKATNTSAPAKPEPTPKPELSHAAPLEPGQVTVPAAPAQPRVVRLAVTPVEVEVDDPKVQAMLPTVKPATATNILATAAAKLSLMIQDTPELRVGMRQRIAIVIEADAPLTSALVALKFDPSKLKVVGLSQGNSGNGAATELLQSIKPNGAISVLVALEKGTIKPGASILFYLEVEPLAAGDNALDFDRSGIRLTTTENRDAFARFAESGLTIKP